MSEQAPSARNPPQARAGRPGFEMGTGMYISGTGDPSREPGAMCLTMLELRSEQELVEATGYQVSTVRAAVGLPGFISAAFVVMGHRVYTISAWVDKQAIDALQSVGVHREAVRQFYGAEFARSGQTGTWLPGHVRRLHVRCERCGVMAPPGTDAACGSCGSRLGEYKWW
jgi:ribosomal protein L37E